jgi:hypothetical protein
VKQPGLRVIAQSEAFVFCFHKLPRSEPARVHTCSVRQVFSQMAFVTCYAPKGVCKECSSVGHVMTAKTVKEDNLNGTVL